MAVKKRKNNRIVITKKEKEAASTSGKILRDEFSTQKEKNEASEN